MRRLRGTSVLAVLALPATLAAQAPLVGTVTDASSGHPIGSVELTIERWGLKTTTDSAGHYRMVLPGGVYQLRARKIGYQPESRVLSVVVADTIHLDLTLTIAPVQLPELTAKAAWDMRYRSEFEQRVKEGFGHFLTPELLRKNEYRTLASLIQAAAPGAHVIHRGGRAYVLGRKGCAMAVWIDGIIQYLPSNGGSAAFAPPDLNEWPVEEIEGVEVYVGPTETPAEYNLTGSDCGVLLIWTRHR